MFMDQSDHFMDDSFDEDFTAAFGQDFQSYLPPRSNSTSYSTFIDNNIPGSNSINSFYTSPATEQAYNQTHGNFSNFSTMHSIVTTDHSSSAPFVLDFGNHNLSENLQQVKPTTRNIDFSDNIHFHIFS